MRDSTARDGGVDGENDMPRPWTIIALPHAVEYTPRSRYLLGIRPSVHRVRSF